MNITNKGIAKGKPNPNGIKKNTVISVAMPINIVTTMSIIAPIDARSVS